MALPPVKLVVQDAPPGHTVPALVQAIRFVEVLMARLLPVATRM